MILIVGAGLAGLSTAFHLEQIPYRVVEKEKEAGGLCRSYQLDGFTFDYTGHLLHFRRPEIKTLVETLLDGRLERHVRRSFVYSHETYTEYPFQVNTHGLPPEVVRDCLLGFIATLTSAHQAVPPEDRSLRAWILENLGDGIAKHFMIPFNEKLWQVSLEELTSDWVSWLVPKPDVRDVVNGALGIKDKAFGYNPTFLYPVRGGIDVLPKAFLGGVRPIDYGTELVEVDTTRRRAVLSDGAEVTYEELVSTIPVPELVARCTDLPGWVREATAGLRCASVYNVNLGVARAGVSDKHWIYFPEHEYPFYRVGFPMNFAPALGPEGCSSMYVELSHLASNARPPAEIIASVRQGLARAGILRATDEVLVADVRDIHYAYVLFDRHRAKALPEILAELERRGIRSIGRYGRWEHTSMEDAMLQGKQAAEQLLDRHRAKG